LELISGTVKLGTMTWSTAHGQIRAGKVVPLAVSSEERVPEFPDVPTLKEAGFPRLSSRTWFGLSGPAKLPAEIVQKLNRGTIEALDKPAARKRLEQDAMIRIAMTPEDYTNLVISETAKWVPLVRQIVKK
jgi:tripartite-type tricarboxylate transporter receptor subunit TctC